MRQERGVTIVEGLVALVILSVGMLGIASLYVTSLKTGRTALLRTQAVTLVNDIIDSIRANGTAGAGYSLGALADVPTEEVSCEADGVCTSDQIADQDLMNWAAALQVALPEPEASIAYTASAAVGTTPDVYTVIVSWRESGDDQRFEYRGSLEMLRVMP